MILCVSLRFTLSTCKDYEYTPQIEIIAYFQYNIGKNPL